MMNEMRLLNAIGLKAALHDGKEIALLDAREEVPFSYRHLLMASCIPLSRLEILIDAGVPRRALRILDQRKHPFWANVNSDSDGT